MPNPEFEIVLALVFYLAHLCLGFSLDDKFRGIFIIMGGCTLIYLSSILPLSVIFVLSLCVPVGLILIIYGTYILYFKDRNKKKGK